MTPSLQSSPRTKESKSQESARVTSQANGSEIVGHCAGQAFGREQPSNPDRSLLTEPNGRQARRNEEVVGEKRADDCFAFWTCSACGDVTEDISPLGPEGMIICEACAEPPRYRCQLNPYVEQFRANK